MADEQVAVMESTRPAESPLVEVTFQRKADTTEKYLEAEPKALGTTQICLSVYIIIGIGVLQAKHLGESVLNVLLLISSLLILIAGNVAVAAKNLHLPTLRACLGMQIVSCAASLLNVILIFIQMGAMAYSCWYYSDNNNNNNNSTEEICHQIEAIQNHFFGGGVLVQATLLAISATLAAYCCKVVRCCGPPPKLPVITIHSPPAQQTED